MHVLITRFSCVSGGVYVGRVEHMYKVVSMPEEGDQEHLCSPVLSQVL